MMLQHQFGGGLLDHDPGQHVAVGKLDGVRARPRGGERQEAKRPEESAAILHEKRIGNSALSADRRME